MKELEADLWLSDPYIEIISEVVSRYDGRRLRSSGGSGTLDPLRAGGLGKTGSPKPGLTRKGPWYVAEGRIGRMEKGPISPVSVVVLSMLSRGPGDTRREEFSFTLRRGREKGVLREGAVRAWAPALAV